MENTNVMENVVVETSETMDVNAQIKALREKMELLKGLKKENKEKADKEKLAKKAEKLFFKIMDMVEKNEKFLRVFKVEVDNEIYTEYQEFEEKMRSFQKMNFHLNCELKKENCVIITYEMI